MKDYKYSVLTNDICFLQANVVVTESVFQRHYDEKALEVQKERQVVGFRKGKAPLKIVRRDFASVIQSETMNSMISSHVSEIIKELNIETVGNPRVVDIQMESGQDIQYSLEFEKHPVFRLKNYVNIPLSEKQYSEEDIKKYIQDSVQKLLQSYSYLVDSDAVLVQDDSCILVDYTVFYKGSLLQNLSKKDEKLDFSNSGVLTGFRQSLVGQKVGSTCDVKIVLPKEYPDASLAQQKVVFKVTIKSIQKKVYSEELTDEIARSLQFKDMSSILDKLKEDAQKHFEEESDKDLQKQLFTYLLKHNKIDVPKFFLDAAIQQLKERSISYQHGNNFQSFPEEKQAKIKDLVEKEVQPLAKEVVQLRYIFKSLAQKENLMPTDEDIEEKKQKLIASQPNMTKKINEYFKKYTTNITLDMLNSRVIDFLKENANIQKCMFEKNKEED